MVFLKRWFFVFTSLISGLSQVYTQVFDWTEMPSGEEKVGYKSFWVIDYSRHITYNQKTISRPILVNMWYPTREDEDMSMTYEDYFQVDSNFVDIKNIASGYKEYNLSTLCYQLFNKQLVDLTKTEKKTLNSYLNQTVPIKRNAEVKDVKFPLIIYHQGFEASYEDNSILTQFLASQGYVVIGSSFFQTNIDETLGVDGSEQSVKDIQFLINYVSNFKNVDISNIALIGHSGGAQASILAKTATMNSIKAVISIETTQEIYGLTDTRWDSFTKPVLENLSNMNSSLLAFTEHKAVFQLFDLMSSSDRYYITFPESLNHNEYISQGISANFLNRDIKNKNFSNKRDEFNEDLFNYLKINKYIFDFIQWKLKGINPPKETFEESTYIQSFDFKDPFVQNVSNGNSNPMPYSFNFNELPTPRQVWALIGSQGADYLIKTLNHFKREHFDDPIYDDIFAFALISDLLEENKISDAILLFNFYEKNNIPVIERFISMAEFSAMMNKQDYAIRCYENLLKVDPDNSQAKSELKKNK